MSKPFDENSIRAALEAKGQRLSLHYFDVIDSTNTYARQLAEAGAPGGSVVIARSQSGGRGRLGRSFHSPEDGIYMSIIIKPDFDLNKTLLVTSAAAVAVCEAIEEVCGQNALIKWVNDIYIDNLKVCGILCEGTTNFETGQIESIVIGIGINTTTEGFPPELLNIAGAVSGDYSKAELAASVIAKTLEIISAIEEPQLIEKYKKRSLVLDKTVKVFKGAYRINPEDDLPSRNAKVTGIDKNGGLIVLYSDGTSETLLSGEISIRI